MKDTSDARRSPWRDFCICGPTALANSSLPGRIRHNLCHRFGIRGRIVQREVRSADSVAKPGETPVLVLG